MTPAQLRTALGPGPLTAKAAALGVTRRTLNRWLAGRHPIPHWVANQLQARIPSNLPV